MNEPIRKLSAVQKSIMEIMFKYLRGEIDEEQYSDEVDQTIEYHRSVKEDIDAYYQGVAAG